MHIYIYTPYICIYNYVQSSLQGYWLTIHRKIYKYMIMHIYMYILYIYVYTVYLHSISYVTKRKQCVEATHWSQQHKPVHLPKHNLPREWSVRVGMQRMQVACWVLHEYTHEWKDAGHLFEYACFLEGSAGFFRKHWATLQTICMSTGIVQAVRGTHDWHIIGKGRSIAGSLLKYKYMYINI